MQRVRRVDLWHTHEAPYLSLLLRGAYVEHYGSGAWDCAAGQVILHAPGETHANRFFERGGELLNLEILPPLQERLADAGIRTGGRMLLQHAGCLQLGLRLQQELRSPDAFSALAIEGLAMEMFVQALRHGSAKPARERLWMDRASAILRERFADPPDLTELAAEVKVHPVHLARAFRKRHGCSVGDYVRGLRVEAACRELRHTKRPIVEIAARNGFADQSHLSRTIRKYTGTTPRNLRGAC